MRNVSVDYEITVPENTTVRAHSGSGNQSVEGIKGNVDLEAGSGDMQLSRLTGDLRFQTGSGNVRGRQLSGPAKVKAGSGDIEIEELGQGDVDIRTGSGNITVSGINGGFRAEAGSGDIRANGAPKSLWNIRTGSGNVDLRVPSESAFDVDISSNSGTVVVDHPVTTTVQGRVQEERKSVVGKVRNGGPTIKWDPKYMTVAGLQQLIASGATNPEIFLLNNNTKPPYANGSRSRAPSARRCRSWFEPI